MSLCKRARRPRGLQAALFLIALLFLRAAIVAAGPGETDQIKLSSLKQKIDELDRAGKCREAIPIAEEHLKLIESVAGPDKPETAASCDKLGELYCKNGEYAKAKSLCERGLRLREKILDPTDPQIAESLTSLAEIYNSMSDYAMAEPLAQRALKIREKKLGQEDPSTAQSLANLAEIYGSTGDYAKAEPLAQRALKIREQVLGPQHPLTAQSVHLLAVLYGIKGDYSQSEQLHERALKIREKFLGSEHPDIAQSLNNLAGLYYTMGNYGKAEPLFQRAILIRERSLGPQHPTTAESLGHLALLYEATGEYAKAEPLQQRALTIREKALGPDSLDVGESLNNLALLYFSMGDYAKAEPLYERSSRICEKGFGPDHPNTAASLSNLAMLYYSTGSYAKAEPLYQRALEIDEKVLGPDHSETATSLANLAQLYIQTGGYSKAEPLLRRSLKINEKALGSEHPYIAKDSSNLAMLYIKIGDYAKARPLLQRALKIDEKSLEPNHPNTGAHLKNLALLCTGMGDNKEALRLVTQARQVQEKNLSDILSFTSEHGRLAFQKTTNPYDLPGTLGNAAELAETVLRQKGVVLDSLLEDQLVVAASRDPKQHDIIDQLRSDKQRLTKLVMEVPNDLSEQAQKQRSTEKEKLSAEVEQLEGSLARQVTGLGKARRALSVTVAQVQSALPHQAALVELLRYSHYLGKDKYEPRCGAIVLGASGEARWVPLGGAAEIEQKIQLYQKSARAKTDEPTLRSALQALHAQIWLPIEKTIPAEAKTVIISPDGELSFVSFATLLGPDDKFVGEKYSIRYVASGRDLLRQSTASANRDTDVYANPDFGGKAFAQASGPASGGGAIALRSVEMRDLETLSLPSLPGTAAEANALEKRGGKSVKVFLGPNATEAELRKVNSPRVLHLATHGFFLPEIDIGKPKGAGDAAEIPKGKLVNPMHRSGLALAGAQRTLESWSRGEVPPTENDGVVTAEEVGGLRLDGTWLVVLSACETGSGEARAGEGVMGLRRGFVQAGAQNLLMTLWPISDQTTVQIMLDFYDAADKTKNAPQALADVQRDWLVKLRKERGVLDAVRLAGPFIMSSQGRQ